MSQVLGVDWSMTATGLTLVSDTRPRAPHVTLVRTEGSKGDPIPARLDRLRVITSKIIRFVRMFDDGTDLYVMIESPLYAAKVMGSQHDRSGGWWMILERLERTFTKDGRRVRFAECSPTTAKLYWTMYGAASKERMLQTARDRFPGVLILDHNAADSIALASMGARRLGFPLEAEHEKILPTALDTVHWWDDEQEAQPDGETEAEQQDA